jgi:hypothetical protein
MAADSNTRNHGGLIEKDNNLRTDTVVSSSTEQQGECRCLELALMRYISAKPQKPNQKKEKKEKEANFITLHSV